VTSRFCLNEDIYSSSKDSKTDRETEYMYIQKEAT